MALGTGSIRFSQIVSEFGGVSPHRFSEYKSLSGLGVSGVPASGTMRFSQFRGKSNQVSTQVWVSSGYNSTSWTYVNYGANIRVYSWDEKVYHRTTGVWYVLSNPNRWEGHYGWWLFYDGGNKKAKTGGRYKSGSDWHYAWLYERVDTWIDTSAYQTQTTTARIST